MRWKDYLRTATGSGLKKYAMVVRRFNGTCRSSEQKLEQRFRRMKAIFRPRRRWTICATLDERRA